MLARTKNLKFCARKSCETLQLSLMEWSSVPIEGGVVVGYLPKLYLVKRAWSTRERQDGDPLALGKAIGYTRSYLTRSLALARAFPRNELQRGLVESILYLIYIPHYFLHLLSMFIFPRFVMCRNKCSNICWSVVDSYGIYGLSSNKFLALLPVK